ncbi:hypothetical protein CBR_g6691 [Chara braunii]|uniref:magnesium chelatase n=1 Tax=Chara braunii TaxID=69332 RepID=A0A388KKH6_CHABU|nr:hypothetical protein CBR_g6691 [Chara braunii]|eukprot:GBG70565.1 hypothetical protein CBR_g6691 [Chara braunii]
MAACYAAGDRSRYRIVVAGPSKAASTGRATGDRSLYAVAVRTARRYSDARRWRCYISGGYGGYGGASSTKDTLLGTGGYGANGVDGEWYSSSSRTSCQGRWETGRSRRGPVVGFAARHPLVSTAAMSGSGRSSRHDRLSSLLTEFADSDKKLWFWRESLDRGSQRKVGTKREHVHVAANAQAHVDGADSAESYRYFSINKKIGKTNCYYSIAGHRSSPHRAVQSGGKLMSVGGGGASGGGVATSAEEATRVSDPALDVAMAMAMVEEDSSKTSKAEAFVEALEEGEKVIKELEQKLAGKMGKLDDLQSRIDGLYNATFAGVEIRVPREENREKKWEREGGEVEVEAERGGHGDEDGYESMIFEQMTEAQWSEIGRSRPRLINAMIESVEKIKWQNFQRDVHSLTLTRDRVRQFMHLVLHLDNQGCQEPLDLEIDNEAGDIESSPILKRAQANIVLISGFESFNVGLYKKAAALIKSRCPGIRLSVFSDRDIDSRRKEVQAALVNADAFFGSLLFDYDQCEWLKEQVKNIPIRLVFESSLELMATTSLGSFQMGGQRKGMPGPVKAVLSKFGGGKEEDRLVGYLSFLKIGPKLLRFVPGKKARDLRNWLTVYGYWNQEYLRWYRSQNRLPRDAPVIGLLLYRKHVVTEQPYISRMIKIFENEGLLPLPIFINGVEAHTVARDLLTSKHEKITDGRSYLAYSTMPLMTSTAPRSTSRSRPTPYASSTSYNLGDLPEDFNGEDLIIALQEMDQSQVVYAGEKGPELALTNAAQRAKENGRELPKLTLNAHTIDWRQLRSWIGPVLLSKVEKSWGELRRYKGIRTDAEGRSVVSGLQLGNIWIGVQPLLGIEGDPMRLLFERDLTPHPQYVAFYKWLQNEYDADAVIHFGMHGTATLFIQPWEFALFFQKWQILSSLLYDAADDVNSSPKYEEISANAVRFKHQISEYRENPEANDALKGSIVGVLETSGLQGDCPFIEATGNQPAVMLTEESVQTVGQDEFIGYMKRLYEYLQIVENRLFSEGLHSLGTPPSSEQMEQYLSAYYGEDLSEEAVRAVALAEEKGGIAEVRRRLERIWVQDGVPAVRTEEMDRRLEEAVAIRDLLRQNTEEIESLIRGLNGDYVLPATGGDLLRDGPGVLPTGRNIHALDPYRMPSAAAWERGSAIAEKIIAQHQEGQPEGTDSKYPETVAVMLWGLDAIKTRGESVAIAVALVGARPVKEGTGRIVRFELKPLEELGRPRIDVLANLSGIFRDSFSNVVELLDDMFERAAEADEPPEMNFIRKHALELKAEGVDSSTSRIFSNPAGDYGSMVNERVGAADWDNGAELGDTWKSRNAFSYGRGEKGVARPEVLDKLLQTTDRIVQEIDSVEYGLTDIQEYYANTGAMKKAAETARGEGGKPVKCSIVETFGKNVQPRDLESALRLEYRAKLLNPKWAQKMADQGSGGAYEISQRMTALLGWSGTTDFKEKWVYDQAADTYALDEEMAAKLRKSNPQAFQNTLKRMLEAAGRGIWKADPDKLAKLQELYADIDNEIESVQVRRR